MIYRTDGFVTHFWMHLSKKRVNYFENSNFQQNNIDPSKQSVHIFSYTLLLLSVNGKI